MNTILVIILYVGIAVLATWVVSGIIGSIALYRLLFREQKDIFDPDIDQKDIDN